MTIHNELVLPCRLDRRPPGSLLIDHDTPSSRWLVAMRWFVQSDLILDLYEVSDAMQETVTYTCIRTPLMHSPVYHIYASLVAWFCNIARGGLMQSDSLFDASEDHLGGHVGVGELVTRRDE